MIFFKFKSCFALQLHVMRSTNMAYKFAVI